jgi:replicative DNA helicase
MLSPSQKLLSLCLRSAKAFSATREAFSDAEAIPGCDGATKALFLALYQGGHCEGSALDQRTDFKYHEAIEAVSKEPEDANALVEVTRERDRQSLIVAFSKALGTLSSGAAPESVSDEVWSALKALKPTTKAPTLNEYVTETEASLEDSAKRGVELVSGLPELDGKFQFRRRNLCTVGARTSHGKTAFATRMTVQALKAGLSVAYLCFEDYGSWLMKFASQYTQLPVTRFTEFYRNNPQERREALNALELCRQFRGLTVVPGMRISEFSSLVTRLPETPDLLVFDYLQKHVEIYPGDAKKNEAAAKATNDFQELCRQTGAIGIMTSQISRAPQEMRSKKPSLEGLKESGDIECYSDQVLLLYWPWRDSLDGASLTKEAYKVIIAKSKLGPCDEVDVRFKGETLTLFPRFQGAP